MKRVVLVLLIMIFLGAGSAAEAFAADPFRAPAQFNLAGSSLDVSISMTHPRLGTYALALNPNPAPVSGYLDFDSVSALTGICRGRMREVSASTQAEIDRLGFSFDFTVTATLNADPLDGIFFWSKNKAAFYPDGMVLTLSFDSESWDIPLSGIPLPADYIDGVLTLDTALEFNENYEGYAFAAVIGLHLVATLESQAVGDGGVAIDLQLNKNVYQPGDRLELRAGLNNDGPERPVDIYVAFFDHENNPFFANDYTSTMTPLLTNVTLSAGRYISLTKILEVMLPAHTPPIAAPGACFFCAVVTPVGSFEALSNWAFAEFTYAVPAGQAEAADFDGEWHGSGVSAVVGGDCSGLADVHLTVVDGQISGSAAEVVDYDADSYRMTGTVNAQGEIVDGVLLEEFMNSWLPVGSYSGTFSGNSGSGTWMDEYGCYGTFSVTKMNLD
ncbi:MAG: hypothetical protein JXR80_04875 [Deltaproteobacteria bacterium]|nr:hypothetical protein [Deltaproteobacteria bacterium]